MPTFEFLQARFTEGVLARSLHGRSPEEFYSYGLEDAENMIPLIEGPMVKRPGTIYVAEAQSSVSRLIPFYKGGVEAYVLEIGYDQSATDDTFDCTFTNTSTTVTATALNVAKISIGQHLWQSEDADMMTTTTAYPSSDTSATVVSIDSDTTFTISEAAIGTGTKECTFSNKPYIKIFSQDKQLGFGGAVTTPYVIKSHRWFSTTHPTDTTKSVDEIAKLSWTQSGDVLFFTCPTRKPFLLSRTIDSTVSLVRAEDNSVWTMSDYVQEDGPYENTNTDPDKSLVALNSVNSSVEVDDDIAFCQFDVVNNVIVLANHGMQVGQKINLYVDALSDNEQIIIKNGTVDPADGGDVCLGGYYPAYHVLESNAGTYSTGAAAPNTGATDGILQQNNYYYVVYATSVSFQISDKPNGAAFDIGYINKDAGTEYDAGPPIVDYVAPIPGNQFTGEVMVKRRIYERNSIISIDSKFRHSTNPDSWTTTTSTPGLPSTGYGGHYFTTDDIGRHIRLNPIADTTTRRGGIRWGWGNIRSITSESRVTVELATDLSVYADDGYNSSVGAGSNEWRLGAFNGYWDYPNLKLTTSSNKGIDAFTGNGYPKLSQIYQQRLCFAATALEPSTVWLSRSGNFYNFAPTELGVQDSPLVLTSGVTTEVISSTNGLYFTIDSDTLDEILWLLDSKQLALGTSAGVYFLYGSENNLTVTPTRFTINRETSYSASSVEPVIVSNVVIYPQRGGREIQELEFSGSEDQWLQTRISMKAYDIISTSNITKLSWQERPNPIIWMIMDNGKLLSLSYDRQVKFKAWSVHTFGGTDTKVTDIAIIPRDDHDQLWLQIERTINGSTKTYIERLSRFPSENVTDRNELVFLDSAIIHKAADIIGGTPTVNGLQEVSALVNGASQTGTSLTVDGLTAVPAIGTKLTIAGDTTVYAIAATPASTITSLKLDQALSSAPSDNSVISIKSLTVQNTLATAVAPAIGTTFYIGSDPTLYTTLTGSTVTLWHLNRTLVLTAADDAVIDVRLNILTASHLEAESVGLCTNGMEHSTKTVSSSTYNATTNPHVTSVTLDHSIATTAISGLFYDASITTLSPPTLENQYNWNKRLLTLTALVQDSLGIRIEYNDLTEELLFRSTQVNTGEPIPLFSGFRKQTLSGIGWNTHNVKIKSISPLPMQINGLSIELETGGP